MEPDSASLEQRAMSYLHSNCAMCHLPDGDGQGRMDFRFQSTPEDSNLLNEPPSQQVFGLEDPAIVVPGIPERSILLHRTGVRDANQMPPIGTAIVDQYVHELLTDWVLSLATDQEDIPRVPSELNRNKRDNETHSEADKISEAGLDETEAKALAEAQAEVQALAEAQALAQADVETGASNAQQYDSSEPTQPEGPTLTVKTGVGHIDRVACLSLLFLLLLTAQWSAGCRGPRRQMPG
ncbi:MAG: hypothetical protein AAF404_15060 [Pseudomonadota bacterium]